MSCRGSLPGPAVVVHWLEQAEVALAAAAEARRPVVLLSAPGAVFTVGPLYFREMVALARARVPEARSLAVLDCGAAAGRALEALHGGLEAVVYQGGGPQERALAAIAEAAGARLLTRRPAALDLLGQRDLRQSCLAWLAEGTGTPLPR